jgi:MarC family membrane protein
MSEFFSAFVLLILIVDPIGNIPVVSAMLQGVAPARRRLVVLRECAIAFVLLLAFLFGGRAFLRLMHLSEESLAIAGGVILFLIAIRMVFKHEESLFGDTQTGEPFIVPLAVPLIAGPSAMASVMLMASREPERTGITVAALTAVMLLTAATLAASGWIARVVGRRAVEALERLMGLVLTAIAVEMLLNGIKRFVQALQ